MNYLEVEMNLFESIFMLHKSEKKDYSLTVSKSYKNRLDKYLRSINCLYFKFVKQDKAIITQNNVIDWQAVEKPFSLVTNEIIVKSRKKI